MPEKFTKAERSRVMAAVKPGDTKPEMIVRRLLHRLGYRFRLHRRNLPGTPDIVLPRYKAIINVHGCFWHMHFCQRRRNDPVNNAGYWKRKRENNASRDAYISRRLRRGGWAVLTIWECQTNDLDKLTRRLTRFLSPQAKS
jgi:DNA mismatch endonuclease (patch repair protein)